MAEVVLGAQLTDAGLAGKILVDSAGTGDWHLGDGMSPPARDLLEQRGYDGKAHRARQLDRSWLKERDLFLAMDSKNLATLRALAGPDTLPRIRLFGEAAGLGGANVPDPWGGAPEEYARVLTMLETGMTRLTQELRDVAGTAG